MTQSKHQHARVCIVTRGPDQRMRIQAALDEIGAKAVDLHELIAGAPVDLVVGDLAAERWADTVALAKQRLPAVRLVALTCDLASAARAVNTLSLQGLLDSTSPMESIAAVLRGALARQNEEFHIERLVQGRTATLQQVKQQWEQSFDALSDPIALMDRDYRLTRVNRAYAAHMGCALVDVPGRRCYDLRRHSSHVFETDDQGPCLDCPVAATSRGQGIGAALIDDAQGRRWAVRSHAVETDRSAGVVCHYRDVTKEMRRLTQLAQADKLPAVGKLAGAVAHELNSPMTSIMVFSEALARKTDEQSSLHEHAMQINDAARRCRRLIQGLLRFARRQRPATRERLILEQVVVDVQPLVQHRVDVAGATLSVDLPADLRPVLAHFADIEHVLVNLLTNAIDACDRGATIAISGKNLDDEGMVEITVSDTGRGMSEAELAAAFDPFFTTRAAERAAGLGLTICEAMLAEAHGSITLESTPGVGTHARFRLIAAGAKP